MVPFEIYTVIKIIEYSFVDKGKRLKLILQLIWKQFQIQQ